jgi:hypothetical protein
MSVPVAMPQTIDLGIELYIYINIPSRFMQAKKAAASDIYAPVGRTKIRPGVVCPALLWSF